MRRILAAAIMLLSLPAVAQERWSHGGSGASFPMTFEMQSITDRRDLGTPNDSVVNYEAATGTESTTVYIFKASVPNARLWFDRAMPIVASQIPMAIFEAGPLEKIAAFGAPSANALRQIFVARQAGPFKSTALVVAQSGPWIVKVRATSATLDRTGLATRIDRHLAAIRIAAPAFAAGVDAPGPCSAAPQMGSGKQVVSGVEQAAVFAIAVHARLHADASQFLPGRCTQCSFHHAWCHRSAKLLAAADGRCWQGDRIGNDVLRYGEHPPAGIRLDPDSDTWRRGVRRAAVSGGGGRRCRAVTPRCGGRAFCHLNICFGSSRSESRLIAFAYIGATRGVGGGMVTVTSGPPIA